MSDKLRQLRKQKGYTREELSNITGINVRTIESYEQGLRQINKAEALQVHRLAKALGVEYVDLLEIEDEQA